MISRWRYRKALTKIPMLTLDNSQSSLILSATRQSFVFAFLKLLIADEVRWLELDFATS